MMGSARAGIDTWLLGAMAVTNVGPYIGVVINSATNMANLYLNIQNGRKIDAVGKQVQAVDQKVDTVNGNVIKVQKGLQHTNILMSALNTEMKIGFNNVNKQINENTKQIGIVNRNLSNLRYEQQCNMETLTEQNEFTHNQLELVQNGVLGLHDRVTALEETTKHGIHALKVQNTETQASINQLGQKLEEFSAFATTGMQDLTAIKTLLQQLTKKDSTTNNNNN